jgi:hypothetical protein
MVLEKNIRNVLLLFEFDHLLVKSIEEKIDPDCGLGIEYMYISEFEKRRFVLFNRLNLEIIIE